MTWTRDTKLGPQRMRTVAVVVASVGMAAGTMVPAALPAAAGKAAATAGAVAAPSSPVTGIVADGGGAGWHECSDATKVCEGTIAVPVDWRHPSGKKIEVGFTWVPRKQQSSPATGTVLAHPGGPGPTGSVTSWRQRLGSVLQRQNLLLIDPRGFGKSTPLRCPEIDTRVPATIEQCADQLGDRAKFFRTDQIVRDFDAVRHAVGAPRVSFYGNSYGTLYAQAYATRFPQRTRAVFLDSVAPTGRTGYADVPAWSPPHAVQGSMDALDVVCDSSPACRALPGDSRDLWARLAQRLRDQPDPQISWRALTLLPQFTRADVSREANAAVAAYVHGDPAPLRRVAGVLEDGLAGEGDARFTNPDLAGTFAQICADTAHPYSRAAPPDQRREQLRDYYQTQAPFGPFEPGEVLGDTALDRQKDCSSWPMPRHSPPVEPGAEYPDVPVLVVGGQLDIGAPPTGAAEVADRFPRATFLQVPFGQHASAFGAQGPYSQCVQHAMQDFLHHPRYPVPDPGCSAENYRAIGSFPRTMATVPPATSSGLSPAQEKLAAAAYYTVTDALARRNPNGGSGLFSAKKYPGLRGGTIRYDDQNKTTTFDRTRYVHDAAVTGTASYRGRATANLSIHGSDLVLHWQPFQATNTTTITGTIDAKPFTAEAHVPG